MLAIVILVNTASEYLLLGRDPFAAGNIPRLCAVVVLLVGLALPKPRWHVIQLAVMYLLIGFFALNYRGTIGA